MQLVLRNCQRTLGLVGLLGFTRITVLMSHPLYLQKFEISVSSLISMQQPINSSTMFHPRPPGVWSLDRWVPLAAKSPRESLARNVFSMVSLGKKHGRTVNKHLKTLFFSSSVWVAKGRPSDLVAKGYDLHRQPDAFETFTATAEGTTVVSLPLVRRAVERVTPSLEPTRPGCDASTLRAMIRLGPRIGDYFPGFLRRSSKIGTWRPRWSKMA